MRARYLDMLMLFTRLAASTLVAPAVLAAGLLTFPTTCTCGAEYPHEHPLYSIVGHHHGHHHAEGKRPNVDVIQATGDVNIDASTGAPSPELTAMQAAAVRLQSIPGASRLAPTGNDADGIRATPDVPPPQA